MANFRPMNKIDYMDYPSFDPDECDECRIWDVVINSSLSFSLLSFRDISSNRYQLEADVIETNYRGEDVSIYFVIDNIKSEKEVDRLAERIVSIIKHDKFTLKDSLEKLGAEFVGYDIL